MSSDPEAISLANEAVANVVRTKSYERVNWEAAVRTTVKHSIWCWWRSIRCRPKLIQEPEDGLEFKETPPQDAELPIGVYDWVLLYEYRIERVALDVLARRRGVNIAQIRRMILQAEDRLIIATLLSEAE